MASLFTVLRFPSLSLSPNTPCYSPSRRYSISTLLRAQMSSAIQREKEKRGTAIVWFKHDLRVDDHPGLVVASQHSALVPLYVFDHRILRRFSDEMLEMVVFALDDLRNSLRNQGSDLMIRLGIVENVIRQVVQEVQATHVYEEEEVEYEMRELMHITHETLKALSSLDECPDIVQWRTPFYDVKSLMDLPDSYDDFMKLQLQVTSPIPPPELPAANFGLDWGSIPTFHELKEFVRKDKSAETLLMKDVLERVEINQNDWSVEHKQSLRRKRIDKSVFITQRGSVVGGGTNSVLNGLAAYLRYLEGTARDDWQEVHEKVRCTEIREGASFQKLFGPALSLGITSRRRVHHEAIKYEKEQNAGFLSSFGYSAISISAAVDAVSSIEWYWLVALKSQISNKRNYPIRYWKWNGFLVQYTVAGHEGPALLLVHGFGAFLEHFRDNIYGIAEGGNRVWAVTILGFGKSEKPNAVYTELMWAELLRDFVVEVVGEPVHLVGNSIGGYFIALFTRFWPALAKSVVIINSAGNVVPGYSFAPLARERQTSGVAWLGARILLLFLRSRIKDIVKGCYPTRTDRADDWLINEMIRASYDPGVLVVLESIFSFDLSIPLNFLLEGLEDKVLIIQGMKDPISNSRLKLAMLRKHCAGVLIKELDAGHCPHDELPEDVNSIIRKWIVTVESKTLTESLI